MTSRPPGPSVERRRRLHVRPAYLILLLFLGLFAYKFIQKTQEVRRLSAQEAALQAQNDQIASDNQRMGRAITYYQTSSYVEGQARALLGYIKPGDVPVQVLPHYRQVAVRAVVPRPPPTPLPVWRQWWQSFAR